MKRNNDLKSLFAFAFTLIVLFTVSVRETHYLFAEHHETNEHCQNHLHGQDEHSHCTVCKFDVSFFTDVISHPSITAQPLFANHFTAVYQSIILYTHVSFCPLRGPPASV